MLHPGQASFTDAGRVERAALLVGPEGGFSAAEVERARAHHFMALTLGSRILRTETAPVVALSILQYLQGDLHLNS